MQDMYHQSHGCGDIFSSRGAFSQERHLFLHGGNTHADSGLVLSTDAKPRLKWTPELHQRFIEAVNQLGGAEKATPKTVMRLMGIPGLTLYHLKSHLQKYRLSKNLQAQGSNGATKSAISCVIPADKAPLMNVPINNSNVPPQTERTIQIGEALQMQIEVQRQLNEQLEVQRHLQLRIEAQGKYLQAVLEKAQETLGKQNTSSTCQEDAKTSISDLVTQASTECFESRFQDCSIGNSLTTSEELRKINYNSNSNLKFEDTSAPPQYYSPSRKEKNRDVNSNFGLANIGAKLDLNSHEENENTDSSCRRFDLNGLSWN